MDGRRFDAVAKVMAATSRRGALRALAGGALAGALGLVAPGHAGAKHFGCRDVGKPCSRGGQCCSGRCKGPKGKETCRAHHRGTCTASQDICDQVDFPGSRCNGSGAADECLCYTTTGGARFCGRPSSEFCLPEESCRRDRECGPDGACVDAGAACGPCDGTGTFCLREPCPPAG